MNLSDLSVKRPVFAAVLSLLLVTFGLVAFFKLPLREYPDIDAPVVSVETTYLGASAAIVERKITQLVEDRVSGIEGIKYIESSSQDGLSQITIEFHLNRDIDAAANDVRDRISRILDELPEEADPPEIFKVDANNDVIMWIGLASSKMSDLELTDYANRFLVDRLAILDGVARIRIGGGRDYAMRIWIDHAALAARGLTVDDVENALLRENVELPAGRIESVEREFTVRVNRSYQKPEDFSALVLRRGDDGSLIQLGQVARVELGALDDRAELRGNRRPTIGLGIIKQSKANTLAVARLVKDEMERIRPTLPQGTVLEMSYDTSLFIEESINEVYLTLGISIFLVVGVIFLSLGSLRATLIPAVTVPISLIASFLVLYAFGYSLNLLTLLALVLAIGLVVDDAIIVLENIYRRIEKGDPPILAAYRGTRQVSLAVIATTLVLVSVFVPITFLEGNVGRLFTEFAVAMAGSVAFSGLVALSLTPMMCSKLLKHVEQKDWLSSRIERMFSTMETQYSNRLDRFLNRRILGGGIIAIVIAIIALCLWIIPSEFAPREDRGVFFIMVNGPEGASYENTKKNMRRLEEIMMPLVENGEANRILARVPRSFNSTGAVNDGIGIAVLKPWGDRNRSAAEMVAEISKSLPKLTGVKVFPVMPQGFGQKGQAQPIQFVIGGDSYEELAKWRDIIMEKARNNPMLTGLDADYKETRPQLQVTIDRNRAGDLGIYMESIGRTLETLLGSRQVTTYPDRGEEYDVILEGMDKDKRTPGDLSNIYVRSSRTDQLIPLANLVTVKEYADAGTLMRYNRLRALTITANLAPGYSLGEALDFLESAVKESLPSSARIDYKGESKEFKDSSTSIYFAFGMALLVAFLVLAAQFESFVHPGVILFTVPLAVAGALIGLVLTGQTMNIFSQIGIIMLVGLAAKNGILIVEFSNQLRDNGIAFRQALVQASAMRLRPILMTSITAVMGAVPLVLAHGAGAESRMVLGVVVIFGVTVATLLTLFIVPLMYDLAARRTTSPNATTRRLEELAQQYPDRE